MGATKQIRRDQWKTYFDEFVKRHLESDPPAAVDIDVLSAALGDQPEVRGGGLIGIVYDPKSNALEVVLDDMDHLAFEPAEIWVVEEDDKFISALEVVHPDGTREIMRLQRSGAPAPIHAAP